MRWEPTTRCPSSIANTFIQVSMFSNLQAIAISLRSSPSDPCAHSMMNSMNRKRLPGIFNRGHVNVCAESQEALWRLAIPPRCIEYFQVGEKSTRLQSRNKPLQFSSQALWRHASPPRCIEFFQVGVRSPPVSRHLPDQMNACQKSPPTIIPCSRAAYRSQSRSQYPSVHMRQHHPHQYFPLLQPRPSIKSPLSVMRNSSFSS